jgi:hypothetical protein
MKFAFLFLIAGWVGSTAAAADGFLCKSTQHSLQVLVYNHTQPEWNAGSPAVMVLADSAQSFGQRTLAVFRAENNLLTTEGSAYAAKIDLRYKEFRDKNQPIAGTTLAQLKKVLLTVAFAPTEPLEAGVVVPGALTLVARDGSQAWVSLNCTRYISRNID